MRNVKSVKKEILGDIVEDIHKEIINLIPSERPNLVILYGESKLNLIEIMNLSPKSSRDYSFRIEPMELKDEYSINVGDKYLEKLAFFVKEDFYSVYKEKGMHGIVLEGGISFQREQLERNLMKMVDVFVYDKAYYPSFEGKYIVNLDNPVRRGK